jgi:gentisate 1,2-dioxygenase
VEDRAIRWKAGDAVYIPVWAWHHHSNASQGKPARYVACENAPLLQNLGVAVREEALG